jgi:hypothetical protein
LKRRAISIALAFILQFAAESGLIGLLAAGLALLAAARPNRRSDALGGSALRILLDAICYL